MKFIQFIGFQRYFGSLRTTSLCIVSCDFVNEEFPTEIQKFANEQQVLNYAKYSNLPYTMLAKAIFFILNFSDLDNYFLIFLIF